MTIILTPEAQATLARAIVEQNLEVANVVAMRAAGSTTDVTITRQEAEALSSAIIVLSEVLSGKVTFS